jgi:hypothetical protein
VIVATDRRIMINMMVCWCDSSSGHDAFRGPSFPTRRNYPVPTSADPDADLARPWSRILDHPQDFGPAKVVDDYTPDGLNLRRSHNRDKSLSTRAGRVVQPKILSAQKRRQPEIGSKGLDWRDNLGIVCPGPTWAYWSHRPADLR